VTGGADRDLAVIESEGQMSRTLRHARRERRSPKRGKVYWERALPNISEGAALREVALVLIDAAYQLRERMPKPKQEARPPRVHGSTKRR